MREREHCTYLVIEMEDVMKTRIDYAAAADLLKKSLALEGSPVAIQLAHSASEIPEGMQKMDKTVRHCQMVNLARNEGRIFYATVENHECMGGAWALGLREISDSLKTGQFYFKLGKFESWAACKRTIDRIPHVESRATYATLYAPLGLTPFAPHVVLMVASPRAMLKLAQTSLYRTGGRITAEFSGIQSVCSDATAQTYLTGRPNFSLGCDGSRRFSGIADGEMVMGLPGELLPEFLQALPVVTGAPGSK
jgi:uncharacterized protein (DUF169 family)